ncbi:spore coat protein [Peribacillus sp. SCS-155]|uniref:spore coat protein n=1 Tax=Peribacillus sedimenti TaxID=3115297 RepID=UPI003906396A
MINDYMEVENAEGMPELADASLAMEFLLTVKTGVRNAANALAETATPELREAFRSQMEAGLALHGELSSFMIEKGWLHPYNLQDQYKMDLKSVKGALMIGGMNLFPGDTSRLGMMAQIDSDE